MTLSFDELVKAQVRITEGELQSLASFTPIEVQDVTAATDSELVHVYERLGRSFLQPFVFTNRQSQPQSAITQWDFEVVTDGVKGTLKLSNPNTPNERIGVFIPLPWYGHTFTLSIKPAEVQLARRKLNDAISYIGDPESYLAKGSKGLIERYVEPVVLEGLNVDLSKPTYSRLEERLEHYVAYFGEYDGKIVVLTVAWDSTQPQEKGCHILIQDIINRPLYRTAERNTTLLIDTVAKTVSRSVI